MFVAISDDFDLSPITIQHCVSSSNERKHDQCWISFMRITRIHKSPKQRPRLGKSDHNFIFFYSEYNPTVKCNERSVRRFSEEAAEVLECCSEATGWDALCRPRGEDINAATEAATHVELLWTTRTVICLTYNTRVFKELWGSIQKQLKVENRANKEAYRKNLCSEHLQHCISGWCQHSKPLWRAAIWDVAGPLPLFE